MTSLKTLLISTVSTFVIAMSSAAIAQDRPSISGHDTSLESINDQFNGAIINGDLNAMMRLYADDVLWMAPNATLAQGYQTPENNYSFVIEQGAQLTHTLDHTFIADDRSQAVMIGRYNFNAPNLNITDQGSYLLVLRPVGKSWTIVADIFNSDLPTLVSADAPKQ